MVKKILIVDDANLIRTVVQKAANEAGYASVEAVNGAEGLDVLSREEVDLVFADINMPVLDGMTMVEKIRELEQFHYLPIVMLTTEADPVLKARAKEMGVIAWLRKPFNKEKFLKVLDKLLG